VFDLEYTALKMLIESEKRQREMGVTMWLIALNPGVLGMVMRSPLGQTLEDGRLIFTIEEAVAHYGRMQDLPKK
jgi:SulP family sulfate permease